MSFNLKTGITIIVSAVFLTLTSFIGEWLSYKETEVSAQLAITAFLLFILVIGLIVKINLLAKRLGQGHDQGPDEKF